jgi:hypothetical protein
MREIVTPSDHEFSQLVVQYNRDLASVGVGLEPQGEVPGLHFVDAIYGSVPTQTEIGRIFAERIKKDRGIDIHAGYSEANAESVLNNELGRMILDAVTGSSNLDGVWTWLDRAGVNRLVRLLRKARDAAFGRDE